MRESRLTGIAFELKNLWAYLTRQELCEYYQITDRTLYNYQNKLNLPRKINEPVKQASKKDKPVYVWVHKDHKYKKHSFKNWEHFVIWQKAQSHSIKIDTMERDGKNLVTCDFLKKKPEAQKYEQELTK